MEDGELSRLLGRKHQAVLELLQSVREWDEAADPENEVLFSENLDLRQEKLDLVKRIDEEIKAIAGEKGPLLSDGCAEQAGKTDEALKQVQALIERDIQRLKNQMEEVSKEAQNLRRRKNGIAAYEKNSLSYGRRRLDVRG
jgi:gas vesicle protein